MFYYISMNKKLNTLPPYIEKLYAFRNNIPARLSCEKIKLVWDIDIKDTRFNQIDSKTRDIINRKISILKKELDWIVLKPLVKFVGISGSVASEFVKEEDDIDLFIVTKNDTVWIYRLYLYFRNLYKKKIRSKERDGSVKDKFCVNFLTEERNLRFESDLFNLNELLYLKPVFNKQYLSIIFLQNDWLKRDYFVTEKFLKKENINIGHVRSLTKRNYILFFFNAFCFLGQLMFMLVMGHNPEIKRLVEGFRVGRVEFYLKNFKTEKLNIVKI